MLPVRDSGSKPLGVCGCVFMVFMLYGHYVNLAAIVLPGSLTYFMAQCVQSVTYMQLLLLSIRFRLSRYVVFIFLLHIVAFCLLNTGPCLGAVFFGESLLLTK